MPSILDLVRDTVTPEITRTIGTVVGETPDATRDTLRAAVPSVLAGVIDTASTPAGAERVRSLIADGGYGAGTLDHLGSMLGQAGSADTLVKSGTRLLSSLFGSRMDGITDLVANAGGVRRSSASTILGLVAPIVMGVIGKQIAGRGLDASGLLNMLSGQRASILSAAPAGLAALFGMRDLSRGPVEPVTPAAATRVQSEPVRVERTEWEPIERDRGPAISRLWPALLAGLAGLGLLFFLTRSREPDVARTATDTPSAAVRQTATVTLPGGGRLDVDQGGFLHQVTSFLADRSSGDVPRRFVFDDLNFESGSTRLTGGSQRTVDALAAVLKAYPSTQVSLEGHTDATGDAAANKKLSIDRAEAVKEMLVRSGVSGDRITVEGYGQERPVASNDSDAGRARNRRTELVVMKR